MADLIKIILREAIIDNPIRADLSTEVEIILQNSSEKLKINNIIDRPRSAHEFIINTQDIGFGGKYNLNVEQSCIILEISLSLINKRILFTTIQANKTYPSIEFDKLPQDVEIVRTDKGVEVKPSGIISFNGELSILIKTKITLDELKLFEIIDHLLKFKIFERNNRNLIEFNIIDSLSSYKDAIETVNSKDCYINLFRAFEKSVNADKDRQGAFFDKAAHTLTGIDISKIENMRNFNNRIKHIQKSLQDINLLQKSEDKFSELVINLKVATNKAILQRLN